MKRSISLILVLIMLLIPVFTACSDSADGDTPSDTTVAADGSSTPEDTTPADALEDRKNVKETLESGLDFGGATFQMIVQTDHINDAWVEELTGSSVDDEVYSRNMYVEELLNIKILPASSIADYGQINSSVQASVLAGDGAYDLILNHAVNSGALVLGDFCTNWYTVPHVNFSNPWYPQESVANLTFKGQMYSSVSDLCLSLTKNTYCMFFDKVKGEDYGLANMYEIVNNGQWTLDKMKEIVANIYFDENGNTKADADDFYGLGTDVNSNLNTYLWSCNQPVFYFTEDDQVVVSFVEEKTGMIIDKVKSILFDEVGATKGTDHSYGVKQFAKGRVLFANAQIGQSASLLADYENDFGIIPYPKYDEAQTEYYTMVDGNFSVIMIPKGISAEKIGMVGATVEALSAYSWKNVIPKYYDIALKTRYVRDQESVAMLDLIMKNRVVDFAYLYDNWQGFVFLTQDIIGNNKEFTSTVATQQKVKTMYYEKKVLTYFLDHAE